MVPRQPAEQGLWLRRPAGAHDAALDAGPGRARPRCRARCARRHARGTRVAPGRRRRSPSRPSDPRRVRGRSGPGPCRGTRLDPSRPGRPGHRGSRTGRGGPSPMTMRRARQPRGSRCPLRGCAGRSQRCRDLRGRRERGLPRARPSRRCGTRRRPGSNRPRRGAGAGAADRSPGTGRSSRRGAARLGNRDA